MHLIFYKKINGIRRLTHFSVRQTYSAELRDPWPTMSEKLNACKVTSKLQKIAWASDQTETLHIHPRAFTILTTSEVVQKYIYSFIHHEW